MNNYSEMDVLEAKEKRSHMQECLLRKYKNTIICLRVNYPGTNKDNKLCRNIIGAIEKIISDIYEYKITCKFLEYTAEGPVAIFILKEEAIKVKKIAVEIEERHILGRCVDIDVYDPNTLMSISRSELNFPRRKCYLCENEAHICVRSQKHSTCEIIKYVEDCYQKYMEKFYDYK